MSAGLMLGNPAERAPIDRKALRRELVARRLALSPGDFARFSACICDHVRDEFAHLARLRVAFCWPIKNEPDLRPLMAAWISDGDPRFSALLPVVVGAGSALRFRAWTPASRLVEDEYGIPAPADGEFLVPDAMLIPVNAFDRDGFRLGYGGGFFDRTLAALEPAPLAIGIGFEMARVESICPEPHDHRLDAVVTENGVFRFD